MSDENAEKAWRDYIRPQLVYGWSGNTWKAFMAGRASRDAEVAELRRNGEAQLARLRANWENECGNLEMAERKVESLRQQLAGSEHARLLSEQKLAKTQAEQQSMEEGFRSFLGSYNRALNGLAERDAVIERVRGLIRDRSFAETLSRDFDGNLFPQHVRMDDLRTILDAAPPSTLDALIRQKQAEAWDEGAAACWDGNDMKHPNPYRNGADHE